MMTVNTTQLGHIRSRVEPAGFTLVEAVMSMLIVGLMLVAALNTIGASRLSQARNTEQSIGPMLAKDLMAEILSQAYEEPDNAAVFGRETGENSGSRTTWDDVDDYNGWSASPPEAKDGSVLSDLDGWTRQVTVTWADSLNPDNNAILPSGLKRINVKVLHQGRQVFRLSTLHSAGWPADGQEQVVPPPNVLFVVKNSLLLTSEEASLRNLMQSFGCNVNTISATQSQSAFNNALANKDVVYVYPEVDADIGDKLKNTAVGVVYAGKDYVGMYGFSSVNPKDKSIMTIDLFDTGHYITSPFTSGSLSLFDSNINLVQLDGGLAPGLRSMGSVEGLVVLAVLDKGATRSDGDPSAGRRVKLPWSRDRFEAIEFTGHGQVMMKRALEWAANLEQPSS